MLKWFLSPFALSVRRSVSFVPRYILLRKILGIIVIKMKVRKVMEHFHKKGTGKKGPIFRYIFASQKNSRRTVPSCRIQKGSGIICVFLATAGLLTVMSLIIRYTSYGIDIAHQRALHEQHYFALRGLLNYGVMRAEQSPYDATIDINAWLTQYTGKIIIAPQDDMINVQACLYVTPNEFIEMQQVLSKN